MSFHFQLAVDPSEENCATASNHLLDDDENPGLDCFRFLPSDQSNIYAQLLFSLPFRKCFCLFLSIHVFQSSRSISPLPRSSAQFFAGSCEVLAEDAAHIGPFPFLFRILLYHA